MLLAYFVYWWISRPVIYHYWSKQGLEEYPMIGYLVCSPVFGDLMIFGWILVLLVDLF